MILLSPPLTTTVVMSGVSVLAADESLGANGGLIVNPREAIDQGLPTAESLFVNLLGNAGLAPDMTGTTELVPGAYFLVPPQAKVWVTAQSTGHRFAGMFAAPYTVPFPPGSVPGMPATPGVPGSGAPGTFPPIGPTGLLKDIPAYLYQEYSDDDDLQGYIVALNQEQQNFVDTFNALNLPIYCGPLVEGKLLDWVAMGLYGMARPSLTSGNLNLIGPLNTWGCCITQITTTPEEAFLPAINMVMLVGPLISMLTSDDLFRRILTWHFFKGDGHYFNNRWLERRVWRFCYGTNGTAPEAIPDITSPSPSIANTSQISVSHGAERNITIRFVLGQRTLIGGAGLNTFGCNGFGPLKPPIFGVTPFVPIPLNDLESTYVAYPPLPMMREFQEALASGVLETPVEFDFTCTIG